MRSFIAVLCGITLIASCSSSDDAADDPRAEELAGALLADPDLDANAAEARCTADNLITTLDDSTIETSTIETSTIETSTIETMLDANGLALDQLGSPEAAITAFDAYLDCVDLEDKLAASLLASATDDEDIARCIAEGFSDDERRTILGASALPGAAVDVDAAMLLLGVIFERAQACTP